MSSALSGIAAVIAAAPPLTPDGEEGRRWAEQELTDPAYDIAEPTPFDRIAQAVGDFIAGIFSAELDGGWGSAVALIAAIVAVVVIVAAFVVWGVPRATRRAARTSPALFGESEERTAAQLRAAAEEHASSAEWDRAIVLRFRAIARSCDERGVLDTPPGTTVHAFARAAARLFPAQAASLETAASAFDDVRYLRRPGTEPAYRQIAATDDALSATRPLVVEEAFA